MTEQFPNHEFHVASVMRVGMVRSGAHLSGSKAETESKIGAMWSAEIVVAESPARLGGSVQKVIG